MYGTIEDDNFSDPGNFRTSPLPSKGLSTSGLQQSTGLGEQTSTYPGWNSNISSELVIVKDISSIRKLEVNSSEDEDFPHPPFKWWVDISCKLHSILRNSRKIHFSPMKGFFFSKPPPSLDIPIKLHTFLYIFWPSRTPTPQSLLWESMNIFWNCVLWRRAGPGLAVIRSVCKLTTVGRFLSLGIIFTLLCFSF